MSYARKIRLCQILFVLVFVSLLAILHHDVEFIGDHAHKLNYYLKLDGRDSNANDTMQWLNFQRHLDIYSKKAESEIIKTNDQGTSLEGQLTLNYPPEEYGLNSTTIDDENEVYTDDESSEDDDYSDDARGGDDDSVDLFRYTRKHIQYKGTKYSRQILPEVADTLTVSYKDVLESLLQTLPLDRNIAQQYIEGDDSFTYKPPLPFLRNLTGNCWLSQHETPDHVTVETPRCLPYFYIAGFPKCASTDIWRRLQALPSVVNIGRKGPHWWTRFRFPDAIRKRRAYYEHLVGNLEFYTHYFSNASIHNITNIAADGSVSTIWDDYPLQLHAAHSHDGRQFPDEVLVAIREHQLLPIHIITSFTPNAKFILMMRDPVDRLWSDYLYFTSVRKDVSQQMFHDNFIDGANELIDCFKNHTIRYCTYDSKIRENSHDRKMRIQLGLYVMYLNDLLNAVPRENVLMISLKTYAKERFLTLQKICEFLGLTWDNETIRIMNEFPIRNRRRKFTWMREMWPETKELVTRFYKPFNEALSQLFPEHGFDWS